MASFKMNIGLIDNCPPAKDILEAMEEFGLPDDEDFGVLNCTAGPESVYATLIKRTNQAIQKLDAATGDVTSTAVEKVTVYPIGLFPARGMLEVYEGAASAVENVGGFLASHLALPTVVNPIEVSIPDAIDKLQQRTERFVLKSVRVSEYAHNSYMMGPYGPKFLDTEHGKDFLEQYADFATSASVRFKGPAGRVTLTLSPKAAFRYSIAVEEDKPHVQALLRQLV
jgi:hypothetical protein